MTPRSTASRPAPPGSSSPAIPTPSRTSSRRWAQTWAQLGATCFAGTLPAPGQPALLGHELVGLSNLVAGAHLGLATIPQAARLEIKAAIADACEANDVCYALNPIDLGVFEIDSITATVGEVSLEALMWQPAVALHARLDNVAITMTIGITVTWAPEKIGTIVINLDHLSYDDVLRFDTRDRIGPIDQEVAIAAWEHAGISVGALTSPSVIPIPFPVVPFDVTLAVTSAIDGATLDQAADAAWPPGQRIWPDANPHGAHPLACTACFAPVNSPEHLAAVQAGFSPDGPLHSCNEYELSGGTCQWRRWERLELGDFSLSEVAPLRARRSVR